MSERLEEIIRKNRHRRRRHHGSKLDGNESSHLLKDFSFDRSPISSHTISKKNNTSKNGDEKKRASSSIRSIHQRVRIIRGEEIMQGSNRKDAFCRPPEPLETPPVPEQMVKFLVLGDGSHLVHQFFYRESRIVQNQNNSQQNRSSRLPSWSVDYHKKDISFWADKNTAICVRTQIWDVISNKRISHRCGEWKALAEKKWDSIVIVGSMSNGYDALEENLRYWKNLLDRSSPGIDHTASSHPSLRVSLLLINNANYHDPSSNGMDPSIWFSMGSNVSSLCQELNIQNWRLISDTDELDSSVMVERTFMNMIRDSLGCQTPVMDASLQRNLPNNNDQQHSESLSTTKIRKVAQRHLSSDHTVVEAQAFPVYSPR